MTDDCIIAMPMVGKKGDIMENGDPKPKPDLPKVSLFRFLPLLLIGVAVVALILNLSEFNNILNVLRGMSVWLVVMAVVAQIGSHMSSGYLLKVIMSRGKLRITTGRGTLIALAAESIGLAGGLASSAALTYYWVSKGDDTSGEAVMAGFLPALYNEVVLIIITIFGMVYLMFYHELSRNQIILYGIILIIIAAVIVLVFYGLKHRENMKKIILVAAKNLNRLLKRKRDLAAFGNKIDQFFIEMKRLGNRGWVKLGVGPAMNVIFDMLTIYLFFYAAGYDIKPGVLIAGYGLSFLLGRGLFFIPGGAGVVEGGMVAIYTNLGVPIHVAVVVVLGYRFISFWLPSLLGFLAMVYLRRTSAHPG